MIKKLKDARTKFVNHFKYSPEFPPDLVECPSKNGLSFNQDDNNYNGILSGFGTLD